jgi:hypothetical protein
MREIKGYPRYPEFICMRTSSHPLSSCSCLLVGHKVSEVCLYTKEELISLVYYICLYERNKYLIVVEKEPIRNLGKDQIKLRNMINLSELYKTVHMYSC